MIMMAQTMIIASREQQQVPRASTTTGSSSKYSNSSSSSTSGDSAFWKFKILQLGLLDAALETTSTQSNDSNERVLSSKGGSMCRRLPMASKTTTGSAGEDDRLWWPPRARTYAQLLVMEVQASTANG